MIRHLPILGAEASCSSPEPATASWNSFFGATAGAPRAEAPAVDDEESEREHEPGAFRYRSKMEMRIQRKVGEAVRDWNLIEAGDRIMVCISGGKDSYALLDMLLLQQRRTPLSFELFAVNVDQGWPGYDTTTIATHLDTRRVPYRMVDAKVIAGIVEDKLGPDATPCSLCSRLRRGVLYNLAAELGCTKIALGHHLDDSLETLLLNLFFSGQLRAMPPRLVSDDERNVVIRPLCYVEEKDLISYATERAYPVVRCSCPTCGLPEQQRQVIKRMLSLLASEHPKLKTNMLAALRNVKPGHLLDQDLLHQLGRLGHITGDPRQHPGERGANGRSRRRSATPEATAATERMGDGLRP